MFRRECDVTTLVLVALVKGRYAATLSLQAGTSLLVDGIRNSLSRSRRSLLRRVHILHSSVPVARGVYIV